MKRALKILSLWIVLDLKIIDIKLLIFKVLNFSLLKVNRIFLKIIYVFKNIFYYRHVLITLTSNVLHFLTTLPNFSPSILRWPKGLDKKNSERFYWLLKCTKKWPWKSEFWFFTFDLQLQKQSKGLDFLWTFGLAYSPLNSATFGKICEVTLTLEKNKAH